MIKKIFQFLCAGVMAFSMCFMLTGCEAADILLRYAKSLALNENYVSREAQTYNEAVDRFFAALDSRDENAVREVFSPFVQENQRDLDRQIELLLEAYEGPTDACGRDGSSVSGSYKSDHGEGSSTVESMFPVLSKGTYYWCWFQLTYENDFDADKIGAADVKFFSASYYCALRYDEAEWPDGEGLSVLTDYPAQWDVRCIGGYPYKFTPSESGLTEEKARAFFENSSSYSDFVSAFGEPNAVDIYYQYELEEEEGKPRYLQLGVSEDTDSIYSASVVDDFGWLRLVWSKTKG